MMLLLLMPTFVAVLSAMLILSLFSVALYYVFHRFWGKEPSEDTKRMAELVATRIGVIYAVLIAMMFANVRIEHIQMV